jgi:hypothetical protein
MTAVIIKFPNKREDRRKAIPRIPGADRRIADLEAERHHKAMRKVASEIVELCIQLGLLDGPDEAA